MMKEQYVAADTPMLPSQASTRLAAWMVFAHAVPTVLGSLMLAAVPGLGIWYLIPVLIFSIDLLRRNFKLIQTPTVPNAKSLFLASNFYLMAVLLAIIIVTPFT